jgi:nucleotide-binding universal stress UspA family protein
VLQVSAGPDVSRKQLQADAQELIAVGACPSQGSQRFLLENIALQIIMKIRSPVLVVREKNRSLSIGLLGRL